MFADIRLGEREADPLLHPGRTGARARQRIPGRLDPKMGVIKAVGLGQGTTQRVALCDVDVSQRSRHARQGDDAAMDNEIDVVDLLGDGGEQLVRANVIRGTMRGGFRQLQTDSHLQVTRQA